MAGDKSYEGGPGLTMVAPADVPHTFKNIGTTPGRLLAVYSPGGFEQFFIDMDAAGLQPGPGIAELEKSYGAVPAK